MSDNPESTTYNTEPVLRSEFLKFKDEILSLISQKETALYNKVIKVRFMGHMRCYNVSAEVPKIKEGCYV